MFRREASANNQGKVFTISVKMINPAEKTILGISSYFHDSAAALVRGSNIIAAAQEERFTRKKADWRFPKNAIDYCLSEMPAGSQLDAIAFYEDPSQKIDRILRNAVVNSPRGTAIWPRTLKTLRTLNTILPRELKRILPDPDKIYFVPHHRSHAASAFYPSPFDEAAVLVVDGVGEWATSSLWHGRGCEVTPIRETRFPHSLGLLYSAFTQYCGFKVNSGEYKLMGLAPFGEPLFKDLIYKNIVEVDFDGDFRLNLDYFDFETGLSTISPLFHSLFRFPPRKPDEMVTLHYMNVAASIQSVLNDIMISQANTALRLTNNENLCMAGGVALNCVTNTKISRHAKGLKKIWVQPAAGDAGGALGAALDISYKLNGDCKNRKCETPDSMSNAYLGPTYNPKQIEKALRKHGLIWESDFEDETALIEMISQALQSGQIIGYFDGRMEFGPRSLGNRSILADPRPGDMLQRANNKIKFREAWRPLAPIILADQEQTFFETQVSDPYMLFVSELKEAYRTKHDLKTLRARGLSELPQYLRRATSQYPTVTHYDYSARTQALTRQANPRLHAILTHFFKKTGCPMLLNTSFNVRGEPIVCSPEDAVNTFLNTHLDLLVIGPFVIKRTKQDNSINKHIGKRRFRAD